VRSREAKASEGRININNFFLKKEATFTWIYPHLGTFYRQEQAKEKDTEIVDLKQQNDLLAKQLNNLADAVKILQQKNQDTK